MPDVYSVILEYKETQEVELKSKLTILVIGLGIHDPNMPSFFWVSWVATIAVQDNN